MQAKNRKHQISASETSPSQRDTNLYVKNFWEEFDEEQINELCFIWNIDSIYILDLSTVSYTSLLLA